LISVCPDCADKPNFKANQFFCRDIRDGLELQYLTIGQRVSCPWFDGQHYNGQIAKIHVGKTFVTYDVSGRFYGFVLRECSMNGISDIFLSTGAFR